ncbi:MAG: 5-formyltetrahydrofolate cyclo-ligase [Parachlamydiales bacterium]|jgi:5-formyltetrahydrofolate cyclo-ligase
MKDQKNEIRERYLLIRNSISITRRAVAEKKSLQISSFNFSKILSFSSTPKEINLKKLNSLLANENRLFLPKIVGDELEVFEVSDIENQLIRGIYNIYEPDPEKCRKVEFNEISCALIPGLAFDIENSRLGYGKGYYDNFLKKLNCLAIGIGFIEQLHNELIPTEPHDIKLNQLLLY